MYTFADQLSRETRKLIRLKLKRKYNDSFREIFGKNKGNVNKFVECVYYTYVMATKEGGQQNKFLLLKKDF